MPNHLVLLGDSIFDNRCYVRHGEPDVIAQVRAKLPAGDAATLLAIDGSINTDVAAQVKRLTKLTPGATHLFISSGGNDALQNSNVFFVPVQHVGEGMRVMSKLVTAFAQDYRAMLQAVLALDLPVTLCTIYNPCFTAHSPERLGGSFDLMTPTEPARFEQFAVAALMMFNDVIIRAAFEHDLKIIELRSIFTDAADYANPIEPSMQGGEKLARRMVESVKSTPPSLGDTPST